MLKTGVIFPDVPDPNHPDAKILHWRKRLEN